MTTQLSTTLEQQQQQRLQAPPSYHPLLGAHYGQPVVSTDYYASRGLDDDGEDESAAGDDDGVGDAGHEDDGGGQYEHVYQNLPHTAAGTVYDKKILPKPKFDDSEDENPYENLPTALEALRIKQAALMTAEFSGQQQDLAVYGSDAETMRLGLDTTTTISTHNGVHTSSSGGGYSNAHTSSMPNLYTATASADDDHLPSAPAAAFSQSQLAALSDAVHINAEQLQTIQTNPQSMIAKVLSESSL